MAGLVVVAVLGFVLMAGHFAAHQSIWVDETTQLSGLALPLEAQLRWLAGGENPIPGVPPDRMPPLSYLLGSLWAAVFGLGEGAMRAFGMVAVLAGLPAVVMGARRVAGGQAWVPGLVGAVYLLSPWTVVLGVEIRAYPLFLCLSAWAGWAYALCLTGEARRGLVWLAVFTVAAGYAHFFGLVMGAVLWLSLVLLRRQVGLGFGRLCAVAGVVGVALLGVIPFVLAAAGMGASGGGEAGGGVAEAVKGVVRLAARLVLHQSHQASVAMWGPALLAVGVLLLLVLRGAVRDGLVARGVLLPLGIAAGVLPLLDSVVGKFDVLSLTYNTWLLPLVLMALACGAGRGLPGRGGAIGAAALVVLLGAHLAADVRLARNAASYGHGSGEWVFAAVPDVASTAVIHDATGAWGFAYFPLHYLSGGALAQYLREPGRPDRRILPGGTVEAAGEAEAFATRIFLRTEANGTRELNAQIDGREPCAIAAFPFAGEGEVRAFCAVERTTMRVDGSVR